MNLYQLRDVINDKYQIIVRRHLSTKVPPEQFRPIYNDDTPLAITLLIETNQDGDYLITLDRKLPFTTIGTTLQIG